MRTFLTLCASCLFLPLTGQPYSGDCNSDNDYAAFLRNGLQGFEYSNAVENYEGDPFFNKWTPGEVMLNNGDIITDIYLRYEKYMDELLWLRENDYKAGIIRKEGTAGFRLFDVKGAPMATFVRKRHKQPFEPDSTDVYFQVLVPGDLTLYAYRRVKGSPNGYQLIEDTKYFLGNYDREFPLILKRKALLNHPLIDKTKMKGILHAGRILLSNGEYEMVRAILLYNSNP